LGLRKYHRERAYRHASTEPGKAKKKETKRTDIKKKDRGNRGKRKKSRQKRGLLGGLFSNLKRACTPIAKKCEPILQCPTKELARGRRQPKRRGKPSKTTESTSKCIEGGPSWGSRNLGTM